MAPTRFVESLLITANPTINPEDEITFTINNLEGSTYNFVIGSANRSRTIRIDGGELVGATLKLALRPLDRPVQLQHIRTPRFPNRLPAHKYDLIIWPDITQTL